MTAKGMGLLLSAITLCGGQALAGTKNDHQTTTTGLSGPYIGVYGGYDWTDLETSGGPDAELDGWEGGAFAGYKLDTLMKRMDGFGIGMNGAIEGFYGVSQSDDSTVGGSLDKEDEWGVSFRPGFSVIDEITDPIGLNPYGILGYRNTKFEGPGSDERFHGFEAGIGTQLMAYGDFGIRAEYAHTWYASESGVDPDSDDVRIGVSYHF